MDARSYASLAIMFHTWIIIYMDLDFRACEWRPDPPWARAGGRQHRQGGAPPGWPGTSCEAMRAFGPCVPAVLLLLYPRPPHRGFSSSASCSRLSKVCTRSTTPTPKSPARPALNLEVGFVPGADSRVGGRRTRTAGLSPQSPRRVIRCGGVRRGSWGEPGEAGARMSHSERWALESAGGVES